MANGHLPDTRKRVTLDEVMDSYDLVGVTEDGTILVADRGHKYAEPTTPNESELSGSGATRYRRVRNTDYNPALTGTRAIDQYKEMKNDSIVRSTLRIAKTPILSARWFMQPASDDPADVEKANFVWKNLTEWMSMSWSQFLVEALYMLDYGTYVFEKVFTFKEVDGERRVVWQKFAPRHPYDITEFIYDDEGGPSAILLRTDEADVELEIWKALIFTYDKEAGDLWGHSLLRSAYKHWFYKENLYKIDAIQKERHGIGIPIIKLPPNYTPGDKASAEKIGINLRTNERAHVVLPPGWEVFFLKLEGQKVDALESAQHHADKLYENVLANFMLTTSSASGESEAQQQMFVRAVRFTAEIIRDVLNHYAIPQLCRFNWSEEDLQNGYPELRVRRLGDERDWRTLSFAVRNLIGAQAMWVDPELRAWLRDELDMPVEGPDAIPIGAGYNEDEDEDEEAGRPTLEQPKVGLPRQSSAAGQGTGRGAVGSDRSGG